MTIASFTESDALAALRFLVEAGVETLVDEHPWAPLSVQPPPNQGPARGADALGVAPPRAHASGVSEATPLGTPAAAAAARDLAAAAASLDALRAAIAGFDGLGLKATATNLVFADGNPAAPLMLIGEAPGAEEDRRGLPFVGASGQLLDRMLAAIGRDRSSAYITNILNWRPPGNRKPSPAEMQLSLPFIERHIALVDPQLVVLLGDTAAKTLTGRVEGITRLRGRWIALDAARLPRQPAAIATFHPAFLLRSPAQKRESWIDLLTIQQKLAGLAG